jgi:ribosomal protein L30/L7E
VRFETAFGTLRSDAFTAQLFRTVSAHLVREPGGRRLLYSYPDDAWLYLTLPADDATRFSMLLAGFFPPEYIEQAIDVLRARRPGTVVLAFETPAIRDVVQQGYDMVEELKWYRIFVRRDSPAPETAGPLPASG